MLQAPMKNSNEKFISRPTVTNCGAQQSRHNCELRELRERLEESILSLLTAFP